MERSRRIKKAVSKETFIFLLVFFLFFGYLSHVMGADKMFKTLMNTAHYLLIDVVFFIMAIAVIAGAIAALLLIYRITLPLFRLLKTRVLKAFLKNTNYRHFVTWALPLAWGLF